MTAFLFALLTTAAFADGHVTLPPVDSPTVEVSSYDMWTWKYVVVDGDTAFEIAGAYGTSVDELKSINPEVEDIDRIQVGQTLRIPEFEEACGC